MRFSDCPSLALLLCGLWPASAQSACMVCDEIITLSADQAACFQSNFDTVLDAIDSAPDGRLPVNMNGCAPGAGGLATRGGVLVMPTLPNQNDQEAPGIAPGPGTAKTVYLLDRSGAKCLRDILAAHDDQLDPSATFDLFEMCQN